MLSSAIIPICQHHSLQEVLRPDSKAPELTFEELAAVDLSGCNLEGYNVALCRRRVSNLLTDEECFVGVE
jgi:hypothetical protein